MKPHSWSVSDNQNKRTPLSDPKFSWFSCVGCNASVVAEINVNPSLIHTAWRMSADCDEEIVAEVLDS